MSKVVLVTGANQGIGLAITERFASAGFDTILSGRNAKAVEAQVSRLEQAGYSVRALRLDVGDADEVSNALNRIAADGLQVSVLINNAGILPDGTLAEMPIADIEASFAINVLGPIRLIRALAPGMAQQGYGRIVNVSSSWSSFANGLGGPGAYGVTKAALNAATVRFARELPSSIKVNAMDPGWVRSRMGGQSATRAPEQAAQTAFALGTLPNNGPTGKFFFDDRETAW